MICDILFCFRTNLPKQLMSFPGFEYDKYLPTFPRQSDVFDYLRRFVEECDLEKFIQVTNKLYMKLFVKMENIMLF